MSGPTVLDIVKEYLQAHGYDGLWNEGNCACFVADLEPCGESMTSCQPGYRAPCDGSCESGKCEFHIVAERPNRKAP